MLIMSLLNFVAWITFVLMCIIQDTVGNLSFWMYIILQLLSGCTLTVILILARNRKNEMLKADTQPVFVDDDDYWKTGFYYNPNDPHLSYPTGCVRPTTRLTTPEPVRRCSLVQSQQFC